MRTNTRKLGKVSITVEKDYHNINLDYDKLTIVEDSTSIATYISRKYVPAGISLANREYWICLGRIDTNAVEYITNVKAQLNAIIAHAATLKDGESAYEIAVDEGFIGTVEEWLASLKGDKGDPGDKGEPGPKGDKGDTGPSGAFLFPTMEFDPATGDLVISGDDIEDNFRFDYETGELIFIN